MGMTSIGDKNISLPTPRKISDQVSFGYGKETRFVVTNAGSLPSGIEYILIDFTAAFWEVKSDILLTKIKLACKHVGTVPISFTPGSGRFILLGGGYVVNQPPVGIMAGVSIPISGFVVDFDQSLGDKELNIFVSAGTTLGFTLEISDFGAGAGAGLDTYTYSIDLAYRNVARG